MEPSLQLPAFQPGATSGVFSTAPPVTAEYCPRSPPVPAPTWSNEGVTSLFAKKDPLQSMGGIFCQTSKEVLLALNGDQADANATSTANASKYRREYECARQDCWRLLDSKQLSPTALEKETYRLWLAKKIYLSSPPVFTYETRTLRERNLDASI